MVGTQQMEESVINKIADHSEDSTRQIARNLNTRHRIVWCFSHDFPL